MRISKTTGWKSPTKASSENKYGRNEWYNLASVMYWKEDTYAFVENGVTKEVGSDNLFITDFGFNLPSTATITNVSIRLRALDNTVGGGDVIDEWLRLYSPSNPDGLNIENNTVKSNPWSDKTATEIIYTMDDWLTEPLTPSIINNNDFGFVYRCRGTNEHTNQPFIYGVQVKVDYTVEESIEPTGKAKYNHSYIIDKYQIPLNGVTTLKLTRECINNIGGYIGKTVITLSDGLQFNDTSTSKTIPAETTEPSYKRTWEYKINGITQGVHSITISSASLSTPLKINILVDDGELIKDKLIKIMDSEFKNCHATSRGGGYYNGNNCITSGNDFTDCKADISGDDYYDAKTKVTITLPTTTAEVNTETTITGKVTMDSMTGKVNKGICHLYVDTDLISSVEVNEDGISTFKWTPTKIGNHNITVKYESQSPIYASSSKDTTVQVTKTSTKLRNSYIIDNDCPNTENIIYRKNYYEVTLYDSKDKPLPYQEITITINSVDYKVYTDTTGTAYLRIGLNYGKYSITSKYDGNDDYNGCTLTHCLEVSQIPTFINSDDVVYYYTGTAQPFKARLEDIEGGHASQVAMNVHVQYKSPDGSIIQKDIAKVCDKNGYINVTEMWATAWFYTITTTYAGGGDYKACKKNNFYICYAEGKYSTDIYFDQTSYSISEGGILDLTGYFTVYNSSTPHQLRIIIYDKDKNIKYDSGLTTTTTQGKFSVTGIDTSTITGLNRGEYTVNALFIGDDFATGTMKEVPLTISGGGTTPTFIEGHDYTEPLQDNAKFINYLKADDLLETPITGQSIDYTIYKMTNGLYKYGKTHSTTDSSGKSELPLTFNSGGYVIEARYGGNTTYKDSYARNLCIIQYNSPSTAEQLHYDQLGNVIGLYKEDNTLADINSDNLWMTFKNILTNEYITNKVALIWGRFYPVPITKEGLWKESWDYLGCETYKPLHQDKTTFVPKTEGIETNLALNNYTFYKGENVYYELVLKDNDGNGISGTVILYLNNEYYPISTDDTGYGLQSLNMLNEGVYTATVYYTGDENHQSCTGTSQITVYHNTTREPVKLSLTNATIKTSTDTGIIATLVDKNDNPITNTDLHFYQEGNRTTLKTDNNGKCEYKPSLPHREGVYNIVVKYLGDNTHAEANETATVTYKTLLTPTRITVYDTTLKYKQGNIYARLYDENNQPITSQNITFDLIRETDHKTYHITRNTGSEGTAIINTSTTPIKAGTYNCTVTYNGNESYNSTINTMKITIVIDQSHGTLTLSMDPSYTFNYIDSKPITVSSSSVDVDGEVLLFDFIKTDGGVVSVTGVFSGVDCVVNPVLDCGVYNLRVSYLEQSYYPSQSLNSSVTVNKSLVSVSEESNEVIIGNDYIVRIKDTSNNPVRNEIVLFKYTKLDGTVVNLNKVTDNNGKVGLTLSELGTFNIVSKLASNINYTSNVLSSNVTVVNKHSVTDTAKVGKAGVGKAKVGKS